VPKSGQPWVTHFEQKSWLFAPFREMCRELGAFEAWPTTADYTELVRRIRLERGLELPPLSFQPMQKKPRRQKRGPVVIEELYDGSIALRGAVPCLNESYHDLFNAIVFAALPRAKYALHSRQFRALNERVVPGSLRLPEVRTREQDALTVFDEGGSVLVVETSLYATLASAREPVAIGDLPGVELVTFGHALLEHAFYGQFDLRSCAVLLVKSSCDSSPLLPWIDERLAARLEDPTRFQAPGADGVIHLDANGRVWWAPSVVQSVSPDPAAIGRASGSVHETGA
jgi:Protein of unknown function (DUF3025)